MEVKSRIPGTIENVLVKEGDLVKQKDILLVMEAMKMETKIPAPVDGEVVEVKVEKGDRVHSGEVLVVIE